MSSVYEIVTEQVLAALEQGTVPWRQPWVAASAPRNGQGRRYHGINAFLLGMHPVEIPVWLTFKQAQALGGSVRKGERSTLVTFWKMSRFSERADDGTVSTKQVPMLRYYRVFNVAQCDGVTLPKRVTSELSAPTQDCDTDDTVLSYCTTVVETYSQHDGPTVRFGGDRAYYTPGDDVITVPARDTFTSLSGYVATLFHECGHSTGHRSRLARKDLMASKGFGSHAYGREELVAEMTSAFLLAEAGIAQQQEQSAAYIASWMQAIKADPRAVVVTAGQAQKAADLVLGREPEAIAA